MRVERITTLTPKLACDILELVPAIKGHDIKWEKYIEYIFRTIDYDTYIMAGVFDDTSRLVGFLHMEQGHPITPEIAFMWIGAASSEVPRADSSRCIKVCETWAKTKGCTKWRMQTRRSPKGFERLHGLVLQSDDYTLEKTICD